MAKSHTSLPTVSLEAMMMSCAIDAKKQVFSSNQHTWSILTCWHGRRSIYVTL